MKCCIKILTVILGLLISSNLVAADITTMKNFGAEDVSNHISAKVLEANKLVISTGYYSVSNPDTFILEGTSENIVYDRVDNWGTVIGYGLFDIIELDLGIHFSYEQIEQSEKEDLISKTDEKAGDNSPLSSAPNVFDFAGVTGMLKLRLLNTSIFKLSLAGLFESKARDTAIYTVSRSSKYSGGWAILTNLTPAEFLSVAFNVGSLYSEEEQLADYKVADRVFIQSLVTVSPTKHIDIFGGTEFKNIKMNSSYAMGNNAYGGLKIKGNDLSLTVFGGRKLDDGGVGFGNLYLGSSISYSINFSGSKSSVKEVKEVKEENVSNKNSQRLDSKKQISNNKKELSLTQKDGIYYDYDGNPIDTKNNFKEIKDNAHDEFYDFDRRIEASSKNDQLDPAVLSEKYYEEELERAKIEKVKKEKAELEQYRKEEIARKKALKKRVDEEDRLDASYSKKELTELKDLPEIYDDEINWNGLK